MYETVLIEKRENNIAVLTLNRPGRLNAMNRQLRTDIYNALGELEADDDVRVVIMTGAGRAFSVGADMNEDRADMEDMLTFKGEERLLNFEKPVIAALNGYALGNGCQYALLCDIIIASEKAILGFIGARAGGPCHIAVWALPAVVGWSKATELLYTCDQISAEEACRIGLVSKVVPHEQLMTSALEMAGKIMKSAPLALKYTKRALRLGILNAEMKSLLREGLRVTLASEDMREAVAAFMEKREPIFRGK